MVERGVDKSSFPQLAPGGAGAQPVPRHTDQSLEGTSAAAAPFGANTLVHLRAAPLSTGGAVRPFPLVQLVLKALQRA